MSGLFSYYFLARTVYIFWIQVLYQICDLQIFSSLVVACLFISWSVSLKREFLIWMKFYLSIYSFMDCAFGIICRAFFSNPKLQGFLPEVLQFYEIFWVTFCIWCEVWKEVQFFYLRTSKFSRTICQRQFFLHWIDFAFW